MGVRVRVGANEVGCEKEKKTLFKKRERSLAVDILNKVADVDVKEET